MPFAATFAAVENLEQERVQQLIVARPDWLWRPELDTSPARRPISLRGTIEATRVRKIFE
jgi:hypothetical protein